MSIAILAEAKTLVEDAASKITALVGVHTATVNQTTSMGEAIQALQAQVGALGDKVNSAIVSIEAEVSKIPTVDEAVAQIKALLAKVPG